MAIASRHPVPLVMDDAHPSTAMGLPHASTEQTLPRPPFLEVVGLAKDKCSREGTRLNITVVRRIWANQEARTDVTAGQAAKSFMPPQGSRLTIGPRAGHNSRTRVNSGSLSAIRSAWRALSRCLSGGSMCHRPGSSE
jgi:hypothetical protein